MKKLIGLILVFVLVFAVASQAFAGSKPQITKDPETATVKKGGKVTFSIKTKGTVTTVIWHFVDPVTGADYTGKKLSGAVKGVKVVGGTNGKKITLNKVPEEMHGWKVYAHVNGNGYNVDSQQATLLIAGMDAPSEEPAEQPAAQPVEQPADETPEQTAEQPAEEPAEQPATEPAEEPIPAETGETPESSVQEVPEEDEGPKTYTITATSKVLRPLDDSGNVTEYTPASSIEVTGIGYVLVSSEDPIISWTLNGIRVQPAEPVNEFRVLNVTSDLSIDIQTSRVSAADAVVDDSHMCKVTCTGCTFSYSRGKLRSVTEGEVPAGAPINIIADNSDLAKNGYSINGAEPDHLGKAGFQFVVNEDVNIVCGQ